MSGPDSQFAIRNSQFRVAFVSLGSAAWPAGPHYLKNLFHAIKAADTGVEIAVLVPEQASASLPPPYQGGGQGEVDAAGGTSPGPSLVRRGAHAGGYGNFDGLVDQQIVVPPAAGWRELILQMQRQLRLRWGPEPAITGELRRQRIDVVFAARDLGPRFPLPVLCWVPDFQPLRLPEMYAAGEVRRLRRGLSAIAAHATRVIVSSRDAQRDFARFAPAAGKARVLPFVAQVPAGVYDADPGWVCERYGLPPAFVYLPNQFWRHKNHSVVIEALEQLQATHPEIVVVCTGQPRDPRHPGYYEELQRRVAAAGLQRQFVMLGLIPHADVYALMRQSVAVLQPSLFEGWSTSVEEAKSLGKRVILSDLPVHREQDPPQATFLAPHDAGALAQCLAETFAAGRPGPDPELEAAARARLPERTRAFGKAFVAIVAEVVEGQRRGREKNDSRQDAKAPRTTND